MTIDEARRIAAELIVDDGSEDKHWIDNAREMHAQALLLADNEDDDKELAQPKE